MTLYIEPEYVVSDSLDATHISYAMLEMTATHLFLASNRWDTAVIEVSVSVAVNGGIISSRVAAAAFLS